MHNPARILIVDDKATNRDILKTRLEVQGYDLLEAANGEKSALRLRELQDRVVAQAADLALWNRELKLEGA